MGLRWIACFFVFLSSLLWHSLNADELRIPAFTAYMMPDAEAARASEKRGLIGWKDSSQSVNWYGQFSQKGAIKAKVQAKIAAGRELTMRLVVGSQSATAKVTGRGMEQLVAFEFGEFNIDRTGYIRFQLSCDQPTEKPYGAIDSLVLAGEAIKDAHFNLNERRNAASVHLNYPVPQNTEVAAFYCEVTAIEDPVNSYYMATGWHRGYFGMQVNSATERRIIFSVWDSGDEAVDRANVVEMNRVTLIGKGEGVYTGDFGNEGTGGHSHLKVHWDTGTKQRFIVTAKPTEKTFTTYAGYWFDPKQQKWMLISAWKAPHEGGYLRGLYSFSEDFGGSSGNLVRKALYGNQWIQTPDGQWIELTTATFSHDPTGNADRRDRFMGVESGQFFLSHGGFVDGFTRFGQAFGRTATQQPPTDFFPPAVPQ